MEESSALKTKWAGVSLEKAAKIFEIDPAMITSGINSGQLEFRHGTTTKGQPWTQVLIPQVEQMLMSDPIGALHLARIRATKDLIALNKEFNFHKKKLEELQVKIVQIDVWLDQNLMPRQGI